MLNRKGLRHRKSQTRTITFGLPTTSVIATRDRVIYPSREAYERDQMSGDENKNVKMCKVCLATFNHEPKCTNTQLQLEGANSLYAK